MKSIRITTKRDDVRKRKKRIKTLSLSKNNKREDRVSASLPLSVSFGMRAGAYSTTLGQKGGDRHLIFHGLKMRRITHEVSLNMGHSERRGGYWLASLSLISRE